MHYLGTTWTSCTVRVSGQHRLTRRLQFVISKAPVPEVRLERLVQRSGEGRVGTEGWPFRLNNGMVFCHAAIRLTEYSGSNSVRRVSIAHATANRRSATLRSARPWL